MRVKSVVLGAAFCFSLGLSAWAQGLPKEVLLVNDPYPPYVLSDGNKQGPGIDMEIAVKVLSNLGVKTKIQLVPFKRALSMLETGEADLTTTLSFREDRDAYLLWSTPYRTDTAYVFYTLKGSSYIPKSLADLSKHKLGVIAGFTYPEALGKIPELTKVEAQDTEKLVAMLLAGRFEVMIVNSIVGKYELTDTGKRGEVQQAGFELRGADAKGTVMGFSKKKNLGPLVEAFNKELKKMIADGSLDKIEKRYLD